MILQPVDYALVASLFSALFAVVCISWRQFRCNPEPRVRNWGFLLTALATAALGGASILLLIYEMARPAGWANLDWGMRNGNGVTMPPGLFTEKDGLAEARRDMAAIHPALIEASHGLDNRRDKVLEPHIENGVKVYDLETSAIRWPLLPDVTVDAYAINGQVPGPRLQIREGDQVRINVTNRLPESTTFHWHGPVQPDDKHGPAEIARQEIASGGTHTYEFTADRSGTYFYHAHDHAHHQQTLGLYGALIIDAVKAEARIKADHEHVVQLQKWLRRESLAYPTTDTIRMKVGETVKLRFIGGENGVIQPMRIHGGPFEVVARDGEVLRSSARLLADAVQVGPGQRYDVIWTAQRAGTWLMHGHIGDAAADDTAGDKGGILLLMIDVVAESAAQEH